jgi:hypothetical protein
MSKMPVLAMFRRFGDLNALSLLLYQAELIKLQKEFEAQVSRDETSDKEDSRLLSKDWSRVSEDDKQWILMEKIRSKIEKYSKSLFLLLTRGLCDKMNNCLYSSDSRN